MRTEAVTPLALTPGTNEWLELSIGSANNMASCIKGAVRPLARICKELKENKAWDQYFPDGDGSWERLCREAIHGTDPEFIDLMIEAAEVLKRK